MAGSARLSLRGDPNPKDDPGKLRDGATVDVPTFARSACRLAQRCPKIGESRMETLATQGERLADSRTIQELAGAG